jgi:hypothetical protein
MRPRSLLLAAVLLALPIQAAVRGRVVDEEGAPVEGVVVKAFARQTGEAFHARLLSDAPEPQPVATATTAKDGSFSLDIKGAGVVDLLAGAPGQQAAGVQAVDGEDFAALILRPAKARSVRVTAAGKPVAGALLAGRFATARTDKEGVVESTDLLEAAYVVHPGFAITAAAPSVALSAGVAVRGRVVAADGATPVANATVFVDGWPLGRSADDGSFVISHAPQRWRSVSAREGQRIGAVSRKDPASYTIALRRGATVSGVVRSAKSNLPIAGAMINLSREGDSSGSRSAITDPKGTFSIPAVPEGHFRVFASHPAFSARPREMRVGAGERAHHDVTMTPLVRVSGLVIDEEKKPVAGASIAPISRTGRPAALTGSDGRFSLTLDPEQSSRGGRLVARKKGYAPGLAGPLEVVDGQVKSDAAIVLPRGFELRLRVVDRAGNPLPEEPVRLLGEEADQPVPGVNRLVICGEPYWPCRTGADGVSAIRVTEGRYKAGAGGNAGARSDLLAQTVSARASLLTITLDRGVEISGRVVFPDGSPAIDTPVTILLGLNPEEPGTPASSTSANADGSFTLTNVPPGRVMLIGRMQGRFPVTPLEVTAPATDVVITIPRPIRIEGRVVDKATMQPVREFRIGIRRPRSGGYNTDMQSFVSDDGTFSLDNIPEEAIGLIAMAQGFAPAVLSDVTARREPLTFQLEPGAKITARVSSDGRPLGNAQVSLHSQASRTMSSSQPLTESEGVYVFDSLAAGDYSLTVMKQGYRDARESVEAVVGADTEVSIDLERGRTVEGRVVDAEGAAVEGARVTARSERSRSTRSDARGAFVIEGLPDNAIVLVAEKTGFLIGQADAAPSSQSVTITLQRGGVISGRVVGLTDRDLAAVRVNAWGGESRPSARVDPSGNFTVEGLPDGEMTVRAVIPGPPMRQTQSKVVDVVNGSAPFVELEFPAGIPVRGRITRNGAAAPGVQISFSNSSDQSGWNASRADGTYEVNVPTAGDYNVTVRSGAEMPFDGGKVSVAGPTTHDIDIRGAGLRGRVVDDATGAPIGGAVVYLIRTKPRGAGFHTPTDSDGTFSAESLSPGTYSVRATKQRYGTETQTVDVVEGVPVNLEFRIHTGERTPLRVVDALDNRPVDSAHINIIDDQKQVVFSGPLMRGGDGGLAVWLLPGRYNAQVWAMHYAPESISIVVPGPEMTIALRRSGRMVVRTTRQGALRVRIRNLQIDQVVGTASLPPGLFNNIAAGSYTVELIDSDQRTLDAKSAVVNPGQTTTVTFD